MFNIKRGYNSYRNYIVKGVFTLLFGMLTIGPIIVLLLDSIQIVGKGHLDWLILCIPYGRRLKLLIHSILLSTGIAVGGMILGIVVGSVLWQWRNGYKSYFRWLLLLMAPIPPYVHALAWTWVVRSMNTLLVPIGFNAISLQGWNGSLWVGLMSLLPIAIGLVLIALESVNVDLMEAGRLMVNDTTCFTRLLLPLATPSILAGGGILFLLTLMDYSIPSLFGVNVYALEIFSEFSATNEPVRAFLLSVPLLIISMIVLYYTQSIFRNTMMAHLWHTEKWAIEPKWSPIFKFTQRIGLAVLLIQIMVPVLSLTFAVGTWSNMLTSVQAARNEITFSLKISTLTALICIPFAMIVARELMKSKIERLFWWIVTLPIALPAPLIGIGLIAIWNKPLLSAVYSSSLMPIFAGVARFTAFAIIILTVQFKRSNMFLIDAARILQQNQFQTILHIWLPMLAPGFLLAGGIVFVLMIGELGATLIVSPPGKATLTMRIYNYLHYGASETVAGLCLMMIVLVIVVGVSIIFIINRVKGENNHDYS